MKRIKLELTEDQAITLETVLKGFKATSSYPDEQAFLQRIITKLAQAKNS